MLFYFILTSELAHWNSKENRRAFFEKYAKDHDFDPLVPSNWYSHPIKRIMSQKVLLFLLLFHFLFTSYFISRSISHSVSYSIYSISYSIFYEGGRSVMMHHDNSPIKALIDLFSEIELDPQKLKG